MKAYVTIPVAGSVTVYLEGLDSDLTDDQLFDTAMDVFDARTEDGEHATWDEWECHRRMTEGNINRFSAPNEFSVEREDDDAEGDES